MNRLRFWQLKVLQLFHDPAHKAAVLRPGSGGHETQALESLWRALGGRIPGRRGRFRLYLRRPDRAATGADRPMLTTPRKKGVTPLPTVRYDRAEEALVAHPLARGAWLRAALPDGLEPLAPFEEARLSEGDGVPPDDLEAALTAIQAGPGAWGDASALETLWWRAWRRLRDDLAGPAAEVAWAHMPADTRCPDHSIWEHLRVTSAVAFLDRPLGRPLPESREPWLLKVGLTPVQGFIGTARSGRDLWMGSFLVADLAWHAMQPVVERYGADAIITPDLRANPRVDHWLIDEHRNGTHRSEALPELVRDKDVSSFAAVLPHTFIAVVPRGGDEHLAPIEEVAAECERAVESRWQELARRVEAWLGRDAGTSVSGGYAHSTWLRQTRVPPLALRWVAVPWRTPGEITALERGHALPGYDPQLDERPVPTPDDVRRIREREARLRPHVPKPAWTAFEQARWVFFHTNASFLQAERGFDYALTRWALEGAHGQRGLVPRFDDLDEPGEKCTLCGDREALYSPRDGEPTPGSARIQGLRAAVRRFWSQERLDPEGEGRERLCGVCTVKRFLVEADGLNPDALINRVWAGHEGLEDERKDAGPAGKARVPFPSTATVAAQRFLADIVRNEDRLGREMAAVVSAHDLAFGGERAAFRRALRSLAELPLSGPARDLLMMDTQTTVFPNALDGLIAPAAAAHGRESAEVARLRGLKEAVKGLRKAAAELELPSAVTAGKGQGPKRRIDPPRTRFAVVRMDGDQVGRLVLGDPSRISARWVDVIHPRVVDAMRSNAHLRDAGWGPLLEAPRLTGPSLQAFVSRALGEFAHRIVPWVVEREFDGRLVYCGGDDLLALAPADQAVPMAARLNQLFRAAWVVDTRAPDSDEAVDPWRWRRTKWSGPSDGEPWRRFAILRTPRPEPAELPIPQSELEPPIVRDEERGRLATSSGGPVTGRLLGLLGPGASLSAGIVFAHYKAPLGAMLHRAGVLLDRVAKEEAGRGAAAMALWSRGGEKVTAVMPWDEAASESSAHHALRAVTGAFAGGALPGRLPYKLRERTAHLTEEQLQSRFPDPLASEDDPWLDDALLAEALDGERLSGELREAVLWLWRQGRRLAPAVTAPVAGPRDPFEDQLEWKRQEEGRLDRALGGLMLARGLSRDSDEEAE